METSEAEMKFPVLGFTPDGDIWGFPDLDRLTRCGPRTLKENSQAGMELIDARFRRWKVISIRRVGRAGSILSLLWIFSPPQSRIEQELEPLHATTLGEVLERSRAAMEAFYKDDYYGDDDQAEYRSTMKKLANARSTARIYDLLGLDTFESW